MSSIEKISIALPSEMLTLVHDAVDAGEYASTSEVMRDALREWTLRRTTKKQGIADLRKLWAEAVKEKRPGVSADAVLDRLERKYAVQPGKKRAKPGKTD
jgi:antitoxin ParD1/3/4